MRRRSRIRRMRRMRRRGRKGRMNMSSRSSKSYLESQDVRNFERSFCTNKNSSAVTSLKLPYILYSYIPAGKMLHLPPPHTGVRPISSL